MNTGIPTVSVCIVTYNHEKFIARCLEGIVMQKTNFSFEVIIGEDCSTDHTKEIIDSYVKRYPDILKPVYLDKNVGASRNNFDIVYPHLSGKYIAICDGDDYWTDPFKLQKQVDFLEDNPDCVLCFHRVDTIDENGTIIYKEESFPDVIYYSWKEIIHLSIPTLTVMYRNVRLQFPPQIYQVKSGDTFLFGILSGFGGAADLGFVGACYRVHRNGVFQGQTLVEKYRQTIQTRKRMAESPFFTADQREEINREVRARKIRYIKKFARRAQVFNIIKIITA